jgi:hypothetical protein
MPPLHILKLGESLSSIYCITATKSPNAPPPRPFHGPVAHRTVNFRIFAIEGRGHSLRLASGRALFLLRKKHTVHNVPAVYKSEKDHGLFLLYVQYRLALNYLRVRDEEITKPSLQYM